MPSSCPHLCDKVSKVCVCVWSKLIVLSYKSKRLIKQVNWSDTHTQCQKVHLLTTA